MATTNGKPALKSAARIISRICELISAFLFAALFVTFVAQVFWRYVLRDPLVWTLEAGGILFVTLSLFTAATQMTFRDHVALELVTDALPEKLSKVLRILSLSLFAGVMILSVPDTVRVLEWMYQEKTFALKFNLGHLFVIMILFVIIYVAKALLKVRKLAGDINKSQETNT